MKTRLQNEVERGTNEIRRRKAPGEYDIQADLLAELGEKRLRKLIQFVNSIYENSGRFSQYNYDLSKEEIANQEVY